MIKSAVIKNSHLKALSTERIGGRQSNDTAADDNSGLWMCRVPVLRRHSFSLNNEFKIACRLQWLVQKLPKKSDPPPSPQGFDKSHYPARLKVLFERHSVKSITQPASGAKQLSHGSTHYFFEESDVMWDRCLWDHLDFANWHCSTSA